MPIGRYESLAIRRIRHERSAKEGERAIAEMAELQAGQIHRDQLRALGLSDQSVDRRVRAGRLTRVQPLVFSVGHARDDPLARWHAAVLSCGDGAVLSHRAGAAHLGIRPRPSGPIEITLPRQVRPREGIRLIRRPLPADEVFIKDDLPVTSPSRTLFDLAGVLRPSEWKRALQEVETRAAAAGPALPDLLARHPSAPGAALIRSLLRHEPPATVVFSDTEVRFAELVASMGLPSPAHHYGIALEGDWLEVDFAWPELLVAVECDSSHHEGRLAMEEDRRRDQALAAAGWVVFRVTWRQLNREPERVARDLRGLLSRRSPASPAGAR